MNKENPNKQEENRESGNGETTFSAEELAQARENEKLAAGGQEQTEAQANSTDRAEFAIDETSGEDVLPQEAEAASQGREEEVPVVDLSADPEAQELGAQLEAADKEAQEKMAESKEKYGSDEPRIKG